jgi:hypothetical protein
MPVPSHRQQFGSTQKPSSARPIQLNAKSEQAIAATDARVAMVFVGTMTKSPFRQSPNSVQRLLLNHGDNLLRFIFRPAVAALPHGQTLARKNPHLPPLLIRICRPY